MRCWTSFRLKLFVCNPNACRWNVAIDIGVKYLLVVVTYVDAIFAKFKTMLPLRSPVFSRAS